MKNKFAKAGFLILAFLISVPLFSLDVPELYGPVNDYAEIISSSDETDLNEFLYTLKEAAGIELAVLTVKSLRGDSLEDFSIRVCEKWGLGRKGEDKGALILVSMAERKIRIETGYGLESVLTDAKCGLIIRNMIAPKFQSGEYGEGVAAGVYAVAEIVAPDLDIKPTEIVYYDPEDDLSFFAFIIFAFIYFILFSGIMSRKFPWLKWLPWAFLFSGPRTRGYRSSSWDSVLSSSDGFGGGFGGYSGHSSHSSFGGGHGGFGGGHGGFGGGGASGGW